MHHGRHALDEQQPVLGSWVHYGLGSLNENLPQFVFLGEFKDSRVRQNFDASYLGPRHAGVQLSLDPASPLPFGVRPKDVLAAEQAGEFALVGELNRLAAQAHPDDEQLRARIQSYELAFRMQSSVPEALDLAAETAETQRLYGIDNPTTAVYGRRLLAARRLAERGVRFTLVYLSRLRRVGFASKAQGKPRPELRARRQADRRAAPGPEAEGTVERHAGGLVHRVRPHARRRSGGHVQRPRHRPRPSSARLLRLVRRRGDQRGHGARRDRRARASTPSSTRTTSPTSTPPCCTCSASTRGGWKSRAANGWRSITARSFEEILV